LNQLNSLIKMFSLSSFLFSTLILLSKCCGTCSIFLSLKYYFKMINALKQIIIHNKVNYLSIKLYFFQVRTPSIWRDLENSILLDFTFNLKYLILF
jgi:hypothetical protein